MYYSASSAYVHIAARKLLTDVEWRDCAFWKNGRRVILRFKKTGEFRQPRKGELYLSGAVPEAYDARYDMTQEYWILQPVATITRTIIEEV